MSTSEIAPHADADAAAAALGARIRTLRQSRGLTLARTAAEAGLSHSFLSQVERGLERLSMNSLFRIAGALGTTQQALLTDAAPRPAGGYEVFRSAGDSPVTAGSGPLTVLAGPRARFVPMMFSGSFTEGEWWVHDEEEFVYVIEGTLEMSIGDERVVLQAGDSTYYEGGVRHRWRTGDGESTRILVVKEQNHDLAPAHEPPPSSSATSPSASA